MSESEQVRISENAESKAQETTIAGALLNGAKKGSLYAMESLLNRSVGMPRITPDVSIENREVTITMNLGKP